MKIWDSVYICYQFRAPRNYELTSKIDWKSKVTVIRDVYFFLFFGWKITDKYLIWIKKAKNSKRSILTSFWLRSAPGCWSKYKTVSFWASGHSGVFHWIELRWKSHQFFMSTQRNFISERIVAPGILPFDLSMLVICRGN